MPAPAPALCCTRCGGTLDPAGGTGLLARCGDCGVLGRIDDPDCPQRLAVLPSIDVASATARIAARLAERGLDAPAVHAHELLFVPVWRVETILAGHVEGEREARRLELDWFEDSSGESSGSTRFVPLYNVRREPQEVRREVQRVHLAHVSGCPLEEFGVPTLDRRRQAGLGLQRPLDRMGRLVVFTPQLRVHGTVIDPLLSRGAAQKEADAIVEAVRAGSTADLNPGASNDVEAIDQDVMLLFYPVLVVRFESEGRRSGATLDASTGEIVSLRLPAQDATALEQRLLGCGGLGAGLLSGAAARAALFPAGDGALPDRAALLAGSLALAAAAVGGLAWLVRRSAGKER